METCIYYHPRARETEESTTPEAPFRRGADFTPKRNNRTQGYVEGASLYSTKRDQLYITRSYIMDPANISWLDSENTTATGKPIIDEVIAEGDWDGSSDGVPGF